MTSTPAYVFPPFQLLPSQRQLLCAGAPIKLGSRAFDLLAALVERRDRVVGKDELLDLVWPRLVVEENNLQVHIVSLRKLLGHPAIATIPGRGYRFMLPVTQDGGDTPPAPADAAAPPAAARTSRGNLPGEPPPLIGRGDDLLRVIDLLAGARLVTICGAAGIGKTRLAQAAAVRVAAAATDGAWWVDLAPLRDASRVPDAVAIAVGLSLGASTDATLSVATALQDRSPLLVLDNAEHLLEGVAAFVERLRAAVPGVRVLVTSQEPLRIADECVFRPEPLSLPDGDTPERIAASGAVGLFVARARAVDRSFELSDDNRATVAEICRRLDGLPLAIELAAARLRLLGIAGLREKLDQRLHVLTLGHRSSPQRHQTLRAALEWSHHLLSNDEQAVLRRLAVFVGGFTLEAAQQVAEDDDGIDRWDVLEHLGALVDKSLVVAEGASLPRYRFLETTRLFALERLIDSGEVNAVRGRHRDHFLFVAETCQPGLLGGDSPRHQARLDVERDNILSALAWAPEPDQARQSLRLAAAMQHYWFLRAVPRLGIEATRTALARPGAGGPSAERCRCLVTIGWLSMWATDHEQALKWLSEALPIARALDDPLLLCLVLTKFAHVRHNRDEPEMALALVDEALACGRPLGDCVELGDAIVLRAHVHFRAREYDQAEALFTHALALRRRMDNMPGAVSACLCLAQLAIDRGRPETARPHIVESLAMLPMADSRTAGLHFIGLVSEWCAEMGDPDGAVLLDAAGDRLLTQAGMNDRVHAHHLARMARAHQCLDEGTRERLRATGAALGLEGALQAARAIVDRMPLAEPAAR